MAKISSKQLLLPSVLDRLIDDSPGDARETAKSRAQVLRELKQRGPRLENCSTRAGGSPAGQATWPNSSDPWSVMESPTSLQPN